MRIGKKEGGMRINSRKICKRMNKKNNVISHHFSKFGFRMCWPLDIGFVYFELKVRFLIKNCVYGQLEMSRITNFNEIQPKTSGGNFSSTTDI